MTVEFGGVYIADVGDEIRQKVLALSGRHFGRATGRVVVAPSVGVVDDDDACGGAPTRVEAVGQVFALEFMSTVGVERLLERTGHAERPAIRRLGVITRNLGR